MSALETYEELLKPCEKLLNQGFCFDQISALSVYSHFPSRPKLLKYNFKHYLQPNQQTCTIASADCRFSFRDLSTRWLLATNKLYRARVNYLLGGGLNTSLQVEVESCVFEGLYRKSLEVVHKSELFNVKVGVDSGKCLNLAAVVGKGCYGAGVDLGFCWDDKEFRRRVLALWYLRKDQRAVVQVAKKGKELWGWDGGSLAAFFWFNVGEQVDLGAKWKIDTLGGGPESEIAVEWKGDEHRTIKGKLSTGGKAALSIRSQVHPLISLLASGRFNILDSANPHLQFSFRVKFNQ